MGVQVIGTVPLLTWGHKQDQSLCRVLREHEANKIDLDRIRWATRTVGH